MPQQESASSLATYDLVMIMPNAGILAHYWGTAGSD